MLAGAETQEYYKLLVQAVHEYAIFGLDANGVITSWNTGAERIKGYSAAEIIGHAYERFFLEEDRAAGLPQRLLSRAAQLGHFETEGWRIRKDGSRFFAEVAITALRGGDGALRGFAKVTRDVTARRKAEQELLRTQQRLRFSLESAQIGEWDLDLTTGEVQCSPEHDRCFGLDPPVPAWTFLRFLSLLHPDDRARIELSFHGAIDQKKDSHFETRVIWPDGTVHWIEVYSAIYEIVDGKPTRMSGITQEITGRKQAEIQSATYAETLEKQVRERTAELTRANADLESFSYSVSHDLRAPLRSIDGFSRLLEEELGPHLNDKVRDRISRIRNATRRMGELIDALLDLSRVSRAALTPERVALSTLAVHIANELQRAAPHRDASFRIEPDLYATGDRRLLRAALSNLLDNAWKFTSRAARPEIGFGALCERGRKVFFVRDNGAGFDMRYADKLFGPFQRLHARNEFEGTGIGLATVRRIILRHGGEIWAEGAVGHGATFYFTLEPRDGDAGQPDSAG
jgi:PAS domain S-box-containing protein